MAALDMLGITEVAAVILKADDIEAELLEIDENLCRHELTPLDRATFLARRKEVYEELYPETKHGGDRKSDQARMLTRLIPSFTDATAQKLGLDSSTIRRAVSLYTGIAQDVRENISGTWVAASGAQLGALARLTPDMQRRVASAVHEFPTLTSVAAILAEIQGTERTPPATRFERFLALWRKMDAREHQQVIEYLAPSLPGAVSREAA